MAMTEQEGTNGVEGGLKRAQSSLELLSQTAAWKENVIENETEADTEILPTEKTRLSPAEQGIVLDHSDRSAHSLQTTKSTSWSDMMGKTSSGEAKPSSFLPPPFFVDGPQGFTLSTDAATAHQTAETVATSSSPYAPGLFLSYSNGSSSGTETEASTKVASVVPSNSTASQVSLQTLAGSFAHAGQLLESPDQSPVTTTTTTTTTTWIPAALRQQLSVDSLAGQLSSAAQGREPEALGPQDANKILRLYQQLLAKDATIAALQEQVRALTDEVNQLRQLPTGKISQIPLEDMLSIMEDYGSEVSDTTMPRRPRKLEVQRASVVRQFRRWNPNFLRHFVHKDGKWVPKLGKMGELARRERVRREAAQARKQQQVQKMQKSSSKDLPKNSR